jgi:predicted CXXCH cytochrome family protein
MMAPEAANVLGDFDDARMEAAGESMHFQERNGQFLISVDRAGEDTLELPVAYTFGHDPLQQYLVRGPGGRLQAFGAAWDSRPHAEGGQNWFHVYGADAPPPGDRLHWQALDQNWNFMCADCHTTGLQKNYSPDSRSFDTSWAEDTVGCEACHGPGSWHVERAKAGDPAPGNTLTTRFDSGAWQRSASARFAVPTTIPRQAEEIGVCAQCHSRRSLIREGFTAGDEFLDHYLPATLSEGLYFADGQIQDEVFVYASFLQSRMHAAGVTCSNCHEPHTLGLRAEGNSLCATCHNPDYFDTTTHHRHAANTPAALCVSCHMPSRTYMQIDDRRDHSFRIPRPGLATAVDAPDVCTGCHQDQEADWAQDVISEWRTPGQAAGAHFGQVFASARQGDPTSARALGSIVTDDQVPAIVRATAVELSGQFNSVYAFDAVSHALGDPDPQVRVAAANAIASIEPRTRFRIGKDLLNDPVRAVRVAAARALSAVETDRGDDHTRAALAAALDEYRAAQTVNADRPEAWINLGSLDAGMGRYSEAREAYRLALELDPTFTPAWVAVADLERAAGQDAVAVELLQAGIKTANEPEWLHHALGLALVRQGSMEAALTELALAHQLAPRDARIAYVYAVALASEGSVDDAIDILQATVTEHKYNRDVLVALVHYSRDSDRANLARQHIATLESLYPNDREIGELAASLE